MALLTGMAMKKSAGGGVDIVPESGKSQKEMPPLKVDEFGRLVKEGASDSDSDDSCYVRKHGKSGRCENAAAAIIKTKRPIQSVD